MKSRYIIFLLLALLAVGLLAAGCGSQPAAEPNQEQDTAANGEASQAPETPAAAEAVSLVEQVKESGHYSFFARMVEDTRGGADNHYGDSCIECHSAVKRLDDHAAVLADFTEGKYKEQLEGITCRVCHQMGGEDMFTLREEGVDACASCHTGENITAGKAVHHPQGEMYKGIKGIDVADTPSMKLQMGFTCYSCHVTNQVDHDFSAPTAAEIAANPDCSSCHSDAEAFGAKLAEKQDTVASKIEELNAKLDAGKAKLETAGEDAKAAYGKALTNVTFVEADASHGLHNYKYATELLKVAEENLAVFAEATK